MSKPSISEINKTFYHTPRDGYKKGNIWIKRKEEDVFNSLLDDIGTSICIDGPTGTGKSSLAITTLKKKRINFFLIQVTKNMTWKQFCHKLLNAKVNRNSNIDFGIDTGVENGLPLFKLHFGFSSTNNAIQDIEYEEKIVERMTDDRICQILYEKKLTLLIDDFERASMEILSNIGEMCKLLTETYITDKAKLVIVGTDDIYNRMRKFNKSLEGRLMELSLGTIDAEHESWRFLLDGFNKLELKHPALELRKGYGSITREGVKQCRVACYEAADGLLKSLNELGKEIAKSATSKSRISKSSIIKTSRNLLERNIRRYNTEYPKLSKLLKSNRILKDVIIYLYQNGVGKIHSWQDIVNSFDVKVDQAQIENAICELMEIDFITRTGWDGEVLFVTNPSLAHSVGVILMNPEKYEVPRAFLDENNQLVIAFLDKSNNSYDNNY